MFNTSEQRAGGLPLRSRLAARSFGATIEACEPRRLLAVFTVTTTADSGPGSLRQAIADANASAVPDLIRFSLPGAGPHIISPGSFLGSLSDGGTSIDATTQPGYAGAPIVELDGSAAGAADGIYITGSNCTISGLVIRNFEFSGVAIVGSDNNLITDCYIGTDVTGTFDSGNTYYGIYLDSGASGNRLLGNLISGNGTTGDGGTFAAGVGIFGSGTDSNAIAFNRIGTDASGTAAVPNAGAGIWISGGPKLNRIGADGDGAADDSEGNLISGNDFEGIALGGAGTSQNIVAGNLIGTDEAGSSALPNGRAGVYLYDGAGSNRIGTNGDGISDADEANLLSGNTSEGIALLGAGTNSNIIAGNRIGTDLGGFVALPNGFAGVFIGGGAKANRIGTNGDGVNDAEEMNLISGNTREGIAIGAAETDSNVVAGNLIGTDLSGASAVPNGTHGVLIFNGASSNRIGSNGDNTADAAERNVISGNDWSGVAIASAGTSDNKVAGNYIGIAGNGADPLGNANHGVTLLDSASANTIGASFTDPNLAAERNIISSNGWSGVGIYDSGTSGNIVAGNAIGMDASLLQPRGNGNFGIEIAFGAANNQIGQHLASTGNLVAFNGWNGIRIGDAGSTGNSIRFNTVWGNDSPQLDLGNDATTMNDDGDADAGPNGLQNYPILTAATAGAAMTGVGGKLRSAPNRTYTLDFYASSAPDAGLHGAGAASRHLGSITVTTNASGLATFASNLAASSSAGEWIFATATDVASGSTSEFSQSRRLNTAPPTLSPTQWSQLGPGPVNAHNFNGPLLAGRVDAALIHPSDPNTVYIGTATGGVWKTTNFNAAHPAWVPLTDAQPSLRTGGYDTLAMSSANPQILYAATSGPGGGILKTMDGGSTWTLMGNSVFDSAEFSSIAISPTDANTIYAAVRFGGAGGGVYKSVNGGVNWTNTTAAIHSGWAADVEIDPSNPQVLYAGLTEGGASNGVYKTVNGGTSWVRLTGGLLTGSAVGVAIRLAVAPSAPNTVYANIYDPALGNGASGLSHRYRTTNGGANWTSLPVPLTDASQPDQEPRYWHILLNVHPTNPNILFINGDHTLHYSIDGGASWTRVYREDSVGGVFNTAGDQFIMVGDRGLYHTSLATLRFGNKQGNLGNGEVYTVAVDPSDPSIVYSVAQDHFAILKNLGHQPAWNMAGGGEEAGKVIVDPVNPSRLYFYAPLAGFEGRGLLAGTAGSMMYRSDDGGASWAASGTGLPTALAGFDLAYNNQKAFEMDPANPSRLIVGLDRVYLSTNAAGSWSAISPVLSAGSFITAIGLAASDPNTIYAATRDGHLFVTTNGGANWFQRDSGLPIDPFAHARDIKVDPSNPNRAFLVVGAFKTGYSGVNKVYMTSSAGASWTNITGNLPANLFAQALEVDWRSATPRLYVGTAAGVYASSNLGANWSVFQSGLPNALVDDLELLPGQNLLTAGTLGRGVWQIAVPAPAAAPAITAASHAYETSPNALVFTFDQGVTTSLSAISVQNIANGSPLAITGFSYDSGTRTARFTFNAPIPDGNYRATLDAAEVTSFSGQPMAADYFLDFFALAGDANRDRKVDVGDLGILATNWQLSPRTFSQADFNYDGIVNVADLGILATNWQKSLQPGDPLLAAPGVAPSQLPRRSKPRLIESILE